MSVSPWDAAALGEYGVSIIALKVLWIVCLVTVRRRNDPLRLPFLWLKWAIPLFILYVKIPHATRLHQYEADYSILLPSYVSLNIANETIILVLESLDDGIFLLDQILLRLYDITAFFSSIADIFILLCLVELGLSFLRAFGKDGAYHIFIRYSNFVAIVVLVALACAALGTDEEWLTTSYYGYTDLSWTAVGNLYGAYAIIYWAVSLAVVFLSSFVLYSSIQKKRLRSVSRAPPMCSCRFCILPVFHLSKNPFLLSSKSIHQKSLTHLCHVCPARPPLLRHLHPQPHPHDMGIFLRGPLRYQC